MPPSAQRRTRTRKIADLAERSDLDDHDSTVTPSRKRRKVTNDSPAPVLPIETRLDVPARRQKNVPSEIKIYEEESSISEEDIDTVIRNLKTAKYNVQARVDFANELHEVAHPEGKEAYAKIAGNSWTFYVNELEIRIGRPPDDRQADGLPTRDAEGRLVDKSLVHIDLGPSKLVSRQHADIRYNEISGQWYINVTGRNGIKVDDVQFGRGERSNLLSGNVIDVAGTQMMFVTPNVVPVIHPTILAQSHAQREENDDDEDDNATHTQPSLPTQQTPTRGQGSRSGTKNRPPSSNDRYSSQQYSNGKQVPQSAKSFSALQDSFGDLQSSVTKSTASPSYSRVLMLESTEDVDYSLDTAKDMKPPHSYAQLIGMAILSSSEEKLTLSKIYEWIKDRYAFYRFSGGGWQNSIRHNLSLNKCFEKIARRTDEPGKGMKWQIVAEHRDEFLKKGLSSAKKSRGSSGPNSPTKTSLSTADSEKRGENPFLQDPHRGASRASNPFVKTSPGSTPPMSHYPVAKEAYTPDRGGLALRHLHSHDPSSPRNGFPNGVSPLPPMGNRARHPLSGITSLQSGDFSALMGFNEAAAAHGSPGGPTMFLSSEAQDHLVTPLITRHAPRLAPPSTAHLPSQFMPMSSPAPFWKYADFGSTPARPNVDISPVKMTMRKNSKKDENEQDDSPTEVPGTTIDGKKALVRSSSPPIPEAELGSGSPTRALSNRGGDRVQSQGPPPKLVLSDAQLLPRPNTAQSHLNSIPRSSMSNTIQPEEEDDDGEEGMIDLARGFQPIGSFHRNMNAGAIRGN